ncbi:hypothetical protein, partial [Pseudoxanthomonas wuyuanensis]|uniref:hypothetical protein n=1 Tax=Pseudoxanthomonas wuyuanensis TaxID=1073196 RepID=UPI001C3EC1FB
SSVHSDGMLSAAWSKPRPYGLQAFDPLTAHEGSPLRQISEPDPVFPDPVFPLFLYRSIDAKQRNKIS